MDTTGRVLHRAAGYDFLAWLITGGRERRFRERLLSLARVQHGESVLDVGCGTGGLAIVAKRQVGPTGSVDGIDAPPNMIARAIKKASPQRRTINAAGGVSLWNSVFLNAGQRRACEKAAGMYSQ